MKWYKRYIIVSIVSFISSLLLAFVLFPKSVPLFVIILAAVGAVISLSSIIALHNIIKEIKGGTTETILHKLFIASYLMVLTMILYFIQKVAESTILSIPGFIDMAITGITFSGVSLFFYIIYDIVQELNTSAKIFNAKTGKTKIKDE